MWKSEASPSLQILISKLIVFSLRSTVQWHNLQTPRILRALLLHTQKQRGKGVMKNPQVTFALGRRGGREAGMERGIKERRGKGKEKIRKERTLL